MVHDMARFLGREVYGSFATSPPRYGFGMRTANAITSTLTTRHTRGVDLLVPADRKPPCARTASSDGAVARRRPATGQAGRDRLEPCALQRPCNAGSEAAARENSAPAGGSRPASPASAGADRTAGSGRYGVGCADPAAGEPGTGKSALAAHIHELNWSAAVSGRLVQGELRHAARTANVSALFLVAPRRHRHRRQRTPRLPARGRYGDAISGPDRRAFGPDEQAAVPEVRSTGRYCPVGSGGRGTARFHLIAAAFATLARWSVPGGCGPDLYARLSQWVFACRPCANGADIVAHLLALIDASERQLGRRPASTLMRWRVTCALPRPGDASGLGTCATWYASAIVMTVFAGRTGPVTTVAMVDAEIAAARPMGRGRCRWRCGPWR